MSAVSNDAGARTAVVIGGGISGLATAALLGEQGYRVTVLEALDTVGGRAGSWDTDGFRFDTGPSWYLMPEVFDHFFGLLGTTSAEELDLVPLTPAYRVYAQPDGDGPGEHVDVVSGREAATELFESREQGAGAKLADYLDSAGDAYDLAVSRFLYDTYESMRGLGDRAVLSQLPRLLTLLTRPLHAHAARSFRDPLLQQILGYPAVFLGASPFRAPSLYHLMSHLDLDDGVLYPRGGFTEVIAAIERLARARSVQIVTGARVGEIIVEGGRATGARLVDGTEHRADVVVSTADLHHTETSLLPPRLRTYSARWWRRRTPSPGALLLLLGVEGDLPQLTHHTLLFTRDWKANFTSIFGGRRLGGAAGATRVPDPASLYVCRPSATDSTVAPPGMQNLFVLVPVPADDSLGHGGVDGRGDDVAERAADRVIDQIAQWTGIDDLHSRVRVRRTITPADFERDLGSWRGSALGLAHTLGQSAVFRPRNVSRRVESLYYAGGSVLPGIGLPMCLISAELVAKRLRGARGAARLSEPLTSSHPREP